MNTWSFIGRVGRDAETRFTPNGDPVVSFSVAVDSGYGDKKKTAWARCTGFGKRFEGVAAYILKGTQIAVVGEVSINEYTNKEGIKQSSLEVRISDVTLIGGKNEPKEAKPSAKPQGEWDDMESDIPF